MRISISSTKLFSKEKVLTKTLTHHKHWLKRRMKRKGRKKRREETSRKTRTRRTTKMSIKNILTPCTMTIKIITTIMTNTVPQTTASRRLLPREPPHRVSLIQQLLFHKLCASTGCEEQTHSHITSKHSFAKIIESHLVSKFDLI